MRRPRGARRAIIAGSLTLACHCGGRSGLDESPTTRPSPPAAAPPAITPEDVVASYPEAFCDRYALCCDRARTTREQCLEQQRGWVNGQAQAPGYRFDPTRASTCLAALRDWAGDYDLCTLRPDEQFASCRNMFSPELGVRYPGESCAQDVSCEGLEQVRCALDASTGQRICQTSPSYDLMPGERLGPCRTDRPGVQARVFACESFGGRTCSLARDRCSYNHGPGESCFTSDDCLEHLACDDATGVCVAARGEGQTCPPPPPFDSLCDAGLNCDDGVCVQIPRATAGEACEGTLPGSATRGRASTGSAVRSTMPSRMSAAALRRRDRLASGARPAQVACPPRSVRARRPAPRGRGGWVSERAAAGRA